MGKLMLKQLAWIACFVFASATYAAPQDGVVSVTAEWKMSLDADGKITALELKPGRVKDALRKVLETAVRGWEFEPGAINGKPAATETNLWVDVSLWPTANDEGITVKVDRVATGGAIAKITRKPVFPEGQARAARKKGINQLVLLIVTYDETGKPGEIVVADDSPVKKGSLVSSAISAVRTWSFSPERVGDHAIVARALLPICYAVISNPDGESCHNPSGAGGAPVASGTSIALDSRVSLKSDVIGRML